MIIPLFSSCNYSNSATHTLFLVGNLRTPLGSSKNLSNYLIKVTNSVFQTRKLKLRVA